MLKILKLGQNVELCWNYIVNKNVINKPEYALYFLLLLSSPFCLEDSFAHSWQSLSQPHEVVVYIWKDFSTILKEFPEMLSTCWLLFLHSPYIRFESKRIVGTVRYEGKFGNY